MADTKVSALTAASAIDADDELVIIEDGNSRRLTLAQLLTYMQTVGNNRIKHCGSQHSVSSTTATEVTELQMALEAGTFTFEYYIIERSATITVAPLYGLNFTGTTTKSRWWFEYADLSSTLLAAIGTAAHDVSTSTLGFGMRQAEDDYQTTAPNMHPFATTNPVQTQAVDILVKITGLIVVGVAGNLCLWHGSETNTATTVEIGSSLVVVRTA